MNKKYHFYKTTVRPETSNVVLYNYTTGLLALRRIENVGQYLGYMTEGEAEELIKDSRGIRRMSAINQYRGVDRRY